MRFTKLKQGEKDKYIIDGGDDKIDEAVQKLAVFENMCENFVNDMAVLPARLEKLRADGKEKTVAYKELVTQKLINAQILMFFKKHGVDIDDI
jgi:hypothetical protein